MGILRETARQDTSRIYVTTPYDPKTIACEGLDSVAEDLHRKHVHG